MSGILRWLFVALTGRGCWDWQKHDWDWADYDPVSFTLPCRRCHYVRAG